MANNAASSQWSFSRHGFGPVMRRLSRTKRKFKPTPLKPISKKGYAKVAWLMARTDTSDLAIFRKFGELNMLNLLCLQGELMSLQEELKVAIKEAEIGIPYSVAKIRANCNTDHPDAMDSDDDEFEPTEVYDVLRRIRRKLRVYNETLAQVSKLESLATPDPRSLSCLQTWLGLYKLEKEPKENRFLTDEENFTWSGTEGLEDFVSVRIPPLPKDSFHERLAPVVGDAVYFVHNLLGWNREKNKKPPDIETATTETSNKEQEASDNSNPPKNAEEQAQDKKDLEELKLYSVARTVTKITSFLIAILSAMIPVLAMVILYFIDRTIIRLWALIGLTVVFSLAVKFCTTAKSSEVFAVAAAFVAVEAVFVGSPPKRER